MQISKIIEKIKEIFMPKKQEVKPKFWNQSLEYIPAIIEKMDYRTTYDIKKTSWRQPLSFLAWSYPDNISDWSQYTLKQELKYAGCKDASDILEPVKTMYRNGNWGKDYYIEDNDDFVFIELITNIKTLAENRYSKHNFLSFFLLPIWIDDKVSPHVEIVYCYGEVRHLRRFMDSKLLDLNNLNIEEQKYLRVLCESVELLCKDI